VAFEADYDYRSIPHLQPDRWHPINASTGDTACFGSRHVGGANFTFADGSVRFISEGIDAVVFEALGTRDGKEAVELP
jgi:prepilin-type processing-associated H-X9-DG protein